MDHLELHPWKVTPAEAIALQNQLRTRVRLEKLPAPPRLVAGADLAAEQGTDTVYAAFVVIDVATLAVVATASVVTRAAFGYIPGLLSFREAPALLEAWRRLTVAPDVVMFDGQGLAHPRRLGIACHMGLLLDRPSLGCGKTILVGRHPPLGEARGNAAPLVDRGEQVGVALRTRRAVAPVYVSAGHRIDLDDAVAVVLATGRGYRIPEPTRQADLLVNRLRREAARGP